LLYPKLGLIVVLCIVFISLCGQQFQFKSHLVPATSFL
jgi:hypothetical protein